MRYLALDVGNERIGLAVSDELALLVRPLEVVRRGSGPGSFLRIAEIIEELRIGTIVVGLPLLPSGGAGAQVRSTEAYVRGLRKRVDTPIVMWDERDSSTQASDILSQSGTRSARRRSRLDAVAAAVILQSYLDAHRGGEQA